MSAPRLVVGGLLLASALVLSGAHLLAHPTAQTFVVVTIGDDSAVTVALTSDARALVLKTDALGGSLAESLDLRFDDVRSRLTLRRTTPLEGRPGFVTAVFTGEAPATARLLTFRSAIVAGAYPLLVRHERDGATTDDRYEWLTGGEASRGYDIQALPRASPAGSPLVAAVGVGFTHIVPKGLDHILFVLGLCLATCRARAILVQVSAFTLAHSVTLGLGVLGLVAVPAWLVEPLIALSIVYVGIQNLRGGAVGRERVVVVFAFGLMHGLGFADALSSLELSGRTWLSTLAGFSLGVELGQLTVIASAAIAMVAVRDWLDVRHALVVPASIVIAVAGACWFVARVV